MGNPRKVTYAKLHGPLFVPGAGHLVQLGTDLIPTKNGSGKVKNLEMSWGDTTLDILVNGVNAAVPHANVICIAYQSEESKS